MTRWTRAGNTQKHKKMPEDPTPWEDFAEQHKALVKKETKFSANKVKKISDDAASTSLKKKIKRRLKETKVKGKQNNSSLLVENKFDNVSLMSEPELTLKELDSHSDNLDECQKSELSKRKTKKKRKTEVPSQEGEMNDLVVSKKSKVGRKKIEIDETEISPKSGNESFCVDQRDVSGSSKNKKFKTGKKKFQENYKVESLSSEARLLDDEECKTDAHSSDKEAKSAESGSHCNEHCLIKKKKKSFFEIVKENRERNGVILLPREVENRLYRMKKALRAKGFSGEQMKGMIREARRKAELNHRRITQKNSKICFNCRESGHIFADCPKVAQDNEQGTGICFKCGSTEHVSFKCHIKTSDFPFAKCFICHNTGHLSRSCPENKHGIYPKGGNCNLCGSVYHLRKDCPKSSRKKNDEDSEVTVHTINELRSVDDEIFEMETKTVKQKKPKIVKF